MFLWLLLGLGGTVVAWPTIKKRIQNAEQKIGENAIENLGKGGGTGAIKRIEGAVGGGVKRLLGGAASGAKHEIGRAASGFFHKLGF